MNYLLLEIIYNNVIRFNTINKCCYHLLIIIFQNYNLIR